MICIVDYLSMRAVPERWWVGGKPPRQGTPASDLIFDPTELEPIREISLVPNRAERLDQQTGMRLADQTYRSSDPLLEGSLLL